MVLVAVLSRRRRKERKGMARGGTRLQFVGRVQSRASGGGTGVLARETGLKEPLCEKKDPQGHTHLLGPEEGSDDVVLCLVDSMCGYDCERVPLVPLWVGAVPCSSWSQLIVLILFRADEAVYGCQVGQEQVVPVDQVEERRQSCLRRRRMVLVRCELGLEVRDGVDQLDEAESERVQVVVPAAVHRSILRLHPSRGAEFRVVGGKRSDELFSSLAATKLHVSLEWRSELIKRLVYSLYARSPVSTRPARPFVATPPRPHLKTNSPDPHFPERRFPGARRTRTAAPSLARPAPPPSRAQLEPPG